MGGGVEELVDTCCTENYFLFRQNSQIVIHSFSVIMEFQKLSTLLFKHDHALYTKSGHSHSWVRIKIGT